MHPRQLRRGCSLSIGEHMRPRISPAARPDQVPRLEKFREDHPDITITDPVSTKSGIWAARREGETLATRYELCDLLDYLEWRMDLGEM